MRFIFFTKTVWDEPPRLRHQLARLLASAGHDVHFFQNPVFSWEAIRFRTIKEKGIILDRYKQLIHHKLRLMSVLHRLNAEYEKWQIKKVLGSGRIEPYDVIVNFNYDYYFLRDLFSENRIVTIINDDFWSRALMSYEKPLRWALKRTCHMSDAVLTVSAPLQRELQTLGSTELFYPWADQQYQLPVASETRDTILFWGYINNKIDYDYVSALAQALMDSEKTFRILFVGPIQCSLDRLEQLNSLSNVELSAAADLDSINLDRVFVGLIPYRHGVKSIDAITLPNKSMRLFSRGIPLAITGMPEFIKEEFVYRLQNGLDQDVKLIDCIQRRFYAIQPSIQEYLAKHTPEIRLYEFMRVVCRSEETA